MSLSSELSLEPPSRTSPSLAVAGFLMVIATFLNANPSFGINSVWPWELFAEARVSLLTKATALIWMLTGIGMLILAITPAYRLRSALAIAAGLILLVQLEGGESGMVVRRFNINEFLPLVGIGGGLLLARNRAAGSSGRTLCLISALAFALAWIVAFNQGYPRVQVLLNDIDVFVAGSDEYRGISTPDPGYPWHSLLPQILMWVAAGGAILVGLGVRARGFMTALVWTLLAAIVLPLGVRIFRVFEGSDPEFSNVAEQVFRSLVEDGIVLWLLLAFAIGDLVHGAPASEDDGWEAS